jgi:hypothetical protein
MKGIMINDWSRNLQISTINLLVLRVRMQMGKNEALITE